jgi:hypothetical protein
MYYTRFGGIYTHSGMGGKWATMGGKPATPPEILTFTLEYLGAFPAKLGGGPRNRASDQRSRAPPPTKTLYYSIYQLLLHHYYFI